MATWVRIGRRAGALALALIALGLVLHVGARWTPVEVANGATPTPTITPAPTITSISPAIGPFAGGTVLTITGTNFATGATVTFDGVAGTAITVAGSTKITVTTPAGTPGAPVIVVTNLNGQAATVTAGFTYLGTPPVLASLAPATGSTNGDTVVTLTGTDFASGMTVTIGGRSATSVTVLSATSATLITPAGSAGAADVVVTNPDTQSSTLPASYTYTLAAPPTVTAVTPNSRTNAGKTAATISGTGFAQGATVTFGTSAATNVVVVSATAITVTVPQGTVNASVAVTVHNPDTQSGTELGAYTYVKIPPPDLWSLDTTSSTLQGGDVVTLYGSDFVQPLTVAFGSTAATVIAATDATITVIVPASPSSTTSSTVSVTVTNPDAQKSTLASAFSWLAPPSITSITPTTVAASGGDTITINGAAFGDGATVVVNGFAATNVTWVSASRITADVPAGAPGIATVTVENPDTQSDISYDLTYAQGPAVTAISPTHGTPDGGTAVTITGTGFVTGDTVTFGTAAATDVTVVDAQTITVTAPAGTKDTTAAITVSDPDTLQSNTDVTYAYLVPVPVFTLGTVPAQGIGFVSFSGGTDAQLVTAANNGGCTASTLAFFMLVDGKFISYIPAAPDAVNSAWIAHFADSIPAGTLLAVRCS